MKKDGGSKNKKGEKAKRGMNDVVYFKQVKSLDDNELAELLKKGVDPKIIWRDYFSHRLGSR